MEKPRFAKVIGGYGAGESVRRTIFVNVGEIAFVEDSASTGSRIHMITHGGRTITVNSVENAEETMKRIDREENDGRTEDS